MMALSGQAWSGFWDPVQYTRVVFFFFLAICSLLPFSSLFFHFCLPFSSRFPGSVSSGLVLQSCLLFPHYLYRSFIIVNTVLYII